MTVTRVKLRHNDVTGRFLSVFLRCRVKAALSPTHCPRAATKTVTIGTLVPCTDRTVAPVLLPCFHVLCQACAKAEQAGSVCPFKIDESVICSQPFEPGALVYFEHGKEISKSDLNVACSTHPDRPSNGYCTQDKEFVCVVCKHSYHKHLPIEDSLPFARLSDEATAILNTKPNAIMELITVLLLRRAEYTKILKDLANSSTSDHELHAVLACRCDHLLGEIMRLIDANVKELEEEHARVLIERDHLSRADAIATNESFPLAIRLRAAALIFPANTRIVRNGFGISLRTTVQLIMDLPATFSADNLITLGQLTHQHIYEPYMKPSELITPSYSIGRDFSKVREPRKVVDISQTDAEAYHATSMVVSESGLVVVRNRLKDNALLVLNSDGRVKHEVTFTSADGILFDDNSKGDIVFVYWSTVGRGRPEERQYLSSIDLTSGKITLEREIDIELDDDDRVVGIAVSNDGSSIVLLTQFGYFLWFDCLGNFLQYFGASGDCTNFEGEFSLGAFIETRTHLCVIDRYQSGFDSFSSSDGSLLCHGNASYSYGDFLSFWD